MKSILNKSGQQLKPHKEKPKSSWKIADRNRRLVASKPKLIGFIIFCIVILLSLTILPVRGWLHSGIAMRGITSIRGSSMEPTIHDNDILFVKEVEFKRGEIVMTRLPDGSTYMNLLKRIVGLPGETVEIKKDGVYINGVLLDEPYTDVSLTLNENNKNNELVLSDNEYFLLGDNRDVSYDSRHVGAFPASGFLYALTTDANSYTHWLMLMWGLVALSCLSLIIVLPILLYVILTQEPKTGTANNNKHKTKMSSKAKINSSKNKKKKKNSRKK